MEKKMIEILRILERASCSCPVNYISRNTNINDSLKILEALEKEGYVYRCKCSDWSPTNYPQFQISLKGCQKLKEVS